MDEPQVTPALPSSDFRDNANTQPLRLPGASVPLPKPTEEPEGGSSLGDLAIAAKNTEWAVAHLDTIPDMLKDYDENQPKVDEAHWEGLDDSHSKEQLEHLRELIDEGVTVEEYEDSLEEFRIKNESQKVVNEFGVAGVGAQFVAAMADPTFLAIAGGSIVVGDKVTGMIMAGNKVSRMTKLAAAMAKAGFTGGAKRTRFAKAIAETALADGTYATLKNQTVNDYSDMDMTVDLLAGLVMVGGFEGVAAIKAAKAADTLAKANAEKLVRDMESKGSAALADGDSKGAQLMSDIKDAGAAQTKSDAGGWRSDDFGQMMNSDNSEVRFFAEHALQDGVGGGSDSAAVLAARTRDHLEGQLNGSFYELWKGHKKTLGRQGVVQQAREMHDLSEKLWEAIVMDIDHGADVSKAASAIRKQNEELLEAAKEAGLNGFKDVDLNARYMKQEWSTDGWNKIRTGTDGLTDSEVSDLIRVGLDDPDELPLNEQLRAAEKAVIDYNQTSNPHGKLTDEEKGADAKRTALTEEYEELKQLSDARKMLAIGFSNRMLKRSDGEARPLSQLLEDEDSLVSWLREDPEFSLKSEAEIKEFVQKALGARTKQPNRNVTDRAKRRITINPAASITKGGRTHRIADLMNRDARGLQQSYIYDMTGNIAFAKRLGIKGPKDWEDMKQAAWTKERELRNVSPTAGTKGRDAKGTGKTSSEESADKVVKLMEEMKREVFGHNRYGMSGDANRWASVLMKYNFTTAMGKAAFSAMSEMGRIMAENRVRNVLKVLPSLNTLITDSFRTVNKHSSIIKEVNGFNASIGDEHLVRYFNSFDETGMQEGRFTAGFLNKAEIVAQRGARTMAKASLLAPMDKMLRMVSFQSSMNSLYSHLIKGKKARLAFDEMGMTKDLRWRIKANMQHHGVETDKWGNVTKLNIDKWDRKTADEMMDAMTSNGARQVQKTFAGENTAITSHPVGRVVLQFRKFAIDSYTKHLRADIRSARNGQALRVMLSNMYAVILAGVGYTARTTTSTVGMDEEDRKKYLDERLAPERLAANMAAYTPSLGPIVSMWNNTGGFMFPDAAIQVARSTGLDNKGIGSNPTSATFDRVGAMFHDIGGSKSENLIDKGRFSLPFQNTIWGDIILNNASSAIK